MEQFCVLRLGFCCKDNRAPPVKMPDRSGFLEVIVPFHFSSRFCEKNSLMSLCSSVDWTMAADMMVASETDKALNLF